ncbi:hypothetical protein RCO27_17115 [Sphingosinicella sp. LHD-64]|uniref:hypothetical protein n=1 Tax=Sphingosinicella sp. LHD-64 TaxID=3072139 RepID=UPI0028106560|nr:hypothetical protein [Sphingosinicella sp. LHD-64]MDQ8757948.1 hypothetical protein [Sphingosinicella sp. LHD-64]
MRGVDFSSWQSILATLIGLALVALIGVGIRLVVMMTIQQRRERMNRQINERLRTLIAAYKVLGGSFTGTLTVDPTHLRDLRRGDATETAEAEDPAPGSDRPRRIRDAVEAALSDIILLGTEEHVRLAERAARELVAGRPVHTHALVVALRSFIRAALDLDPIPADLDIPMQGPTRPAGAGGGRGKAERGGGDARQDGGGRGGGGTGAGMGGMGMGLGLGTAAAAGDDPPTPGLQP